ncbi:hypothetical protein [Luteimicrobium subarcticum]|uniref:hypothetical protein n=1 Tax=Luteimicrobium subarcticum TaxID=620910 RepID=UPI000C239A53|nr:hypothetical protein [Luteimicrobium subarcticum]
MSDADDFRTIIRDLNDPDAAMKASAADGLAAWISSAATPRRIEPLVRALAVTLSIEDDEGAQKAELKAMVEISSSELLPREVIVQVIGSRTWDPRWAGELIESLKEDLEDLSD